VSSMPEVAGGAAVLVPPDDVTGLGAALVRVAGDHALRDDLICRGLARAKAFNWDRCARETIAVYEAALRGREP
ncbi:MAG: glycosyltransferase family 1 protein, partial [Gemmatimonadales bacterium]